MKNSPQICNRAIELCKTLRVHFLIFIDCSDGKKAKKDIYLPKNVEFFHCYSFTVHIFFSLIDMNMKVRASSHRWCMSSSQKNVLAQLQTTKLKQ